MSEGSIPQIPKILETKSHVITTIQTLFRHETKFFESDLSSLLNDAKLSYSGIYGKILKNHSFFTESVPNEYYLISAVADYGTKRPIWFLQHRRDVKLMARLVSGDPLETIKEGFVDADCAEGDEEAYKEIANQICAIVSRAFRDITKREGSITITDLKRTQFDETVLSSFPTNDILLTQLDFTIGDFPESFLLQFAEVELYADILSELDKGIKEDINLFAKEIETFDPNQKRTVLVVDDYSQIRRVICWMLQKNNYETFEAGDGAEALKMLDKKKIDIVLMDTMMPIMDGITALKEIRKNPKTENVPVVFCTALGGESNIINVIKSGGDDYIVKPFKEATILNKIRSTLERGRFKPTS